MAASSPSQKEVIVLFEWIKRKPIPGCSAAAVVGLLFLISCPTWSQQQTSDLASRSLQDLMDIKIYSASRYTQAASEAPASVSVVTRKEIQRRGYRTLADILRSVRGFYISYDRQYSYVGARGYSNPGDYNTRILLMVDGHRLNDPIFEQAMIGTEFSLDVNLIERVEIVRGPASSLYGTNAVFAVINVITRQAHDIQGLEMEGDAASYNSYKGRISYGGQVAGIDMVLSGSFYGSKGANSLFYPEFDSPSTNYGIASHADDDQYVDLLATLSSHGFKFQSVYNMREKGDPTGAWGDIFSDRRSRETDGHGYLDLRYEHTLGPDGTLMARTYFDRVVYDGSFPHSNGNGSIWNKDFGRGEDWGTEVQATYNFHNAKLVEGLEYRSDFRQQLANFDVAPPTLYFNFDKPSYVVAPYVQGEIALRKGLTFSPGLRWDYNPRVGWMTSPRGSLNYRARPNTTLKVIYGQAFRSPNTYEMYYYPSSGPALEPERLKSWEGDWDQKLNHNLSASLSVFANDMDHFISLDTTSYSDAVFRNFGQTTSDGAEFELRGQWANGINGHTSYSYELKEEGVDHQHLIASPKHLGKADLTVPLLDRKLFATVDAQFVGRRLTLRQDTVSPYTVVNFTLLGHSLTRNLDLSASVYNAFDKRYFDPGGQQHVQDGLQQDGRNLRIQLVWRLGAQ